MTACAPPNENCAPPKRGLCPEEITVSELLECKSRPKLEFASGIFVIFVDWRRISWHFWDEDLFFLEITCFRPEKVLKFLISAGKSLWIFGLHFVHLIQTRINFSCPRAPLEFTKINFSCPPQKIYFCSPQKIYFCPPQKIYFCPPQKIYFCPPPPVTLPWRRACSRRY